MIVGGELVISGEWSAGAVTTIGVTNPIVALDKVVLIRVLG
jgi:hypothetical protein